MCNGGGEKDMLSTKIKGSLPKMVLIMATSAVKEGVKAQKRAEKEYLKEKEKETQNKPYDLPIAHAHKDAVRIAVEPLFNYFNAWVLIV